MSASFTKRFGRTILTVLTAFLLAACSGGGGNSGAPGGPGGSSNGCSVGVPTSFTQWTGTKQLGVAGQYTWANAVAVDANDNVYVAGITSGALDCVAVTSGAAAFLIKYDSFGNRLFTRLLNSTVPDFTASDAVEAQALAVDPVNGDVYVAGYTFTGADGNPLMGLQDFFLTKYDSSGNKLFTQELGVTGEYTQAFAVVVDSTHGYVYVAGDTTGGLDGNMLSGTGATDYFFTRFNLDGSNRITVQNGVTGQLTSAYSAAMDANGNLYLAGITSGGLNGNMLMGNYDFFLAQYLFGGTTPVTVKQLGVPGTTTKATGVAVDSSGTHWFVSGSTFGALDGQSLTGVEDVFLTPYNGGTKGGTKQLGAAGAHTEAFAIALDSVNQRVYVAGDTDGALGSNTLSGAGATDYFFTAYDFAGNIQFTRQNGVAGVSTFANGVATDSLGNVYVVGGTSGGLDGNTVTGTTDFFVTKYDSLGIKQ